MFRIQERERASETNVFSQSSPSNCVEYRLYEKGNTSSASREICYILWNPTAHNRAYNSPPLVRLRSQINTPVPSTFVTLMPVLVLFSPSISRSSHLFLSFRFSHLQLVRNSLFPTYVQRALPTSSSLTRPSIRPCMELQPFLGLWPPSRGAPYSSLSPARFLHPRIHRTYNASLWTMSSHLVLGFPFDLTTQVIFGEQYKS